MTPPAASSWRRLVTGMLPAALLVAAVYWWTATDGHGSWNTRPNQKNLYHDQTRAFADGQAHLSLAVHPALLAAPNPYDPEFNRPYRVLDAALYHGQYHTYYGVAPILGWLLPMRILTGFLPPEDVTLFIFLTGAFILQALTLVGLENRFFPRCPPWLGGVALLVAGLGGPWLPLLRRHSFLEFAQAGGIFCVSGGFLCLLLGLTAARSRTAWLALASAAFGMAAGCRPNLLLLAALPAAALALGGRTPRARWFSAIIPASAIIAGLLFYNQMRFQQLLEFGQSYVMADLDQHSHSPFSLWFVHYNLHYYLFSWPRLSPYFPFFLESGPAPFPVPAGHDIATAQVIGWLVGYPVLFLGSSLFAFQAWRMRQRKLSAWIGTVALAFVLVFLPLTAFAGLTVRYQAEASLPLALLAGGGIAALDFGRLGSWSRTLLGFMLAGTGLISILTGFLISWQIDGLFHRSNPKVFAQMTRQADALLYHRLGKFAGRPAVAVITTHLPAGRTGRIEPLLMHGRVPAADFLYVVYVSPTHVQFGYESMGNGGPVSEPIFVDYNQPHTIELVLGPLLPPAGHPYYREAGLGDGRPLEQLLRVRLDGRIVLDAWVQYHRGLELFSWGAAQDEPAFADPFSGAGFTVRQQPFEPAMVADLRDPASYGDIRLQVRWPAGPAPHSEPLLSVGSKNQGQLVYVRFLDGKRMRLGLVGTGLAAAESEELPVETTTIVPVNIRLPALYPFPGLASARATISVGGRVVLDAPAGDFSAPPGSVVVGRNTLLHDGVTLGFEGEISGISREKP